MGISLKVTHVADSDSAVTDVYSKGIKLISH